MSDEGLTAIAMEFCLDCGGEGTVPVYVQGRQISVEVCPKCGGTGEAGPGYDEYLGEVRPGTRERNGLWRSLRGITEGRA